MSEINSIELNETKALETSEKIKQAAQKFEQAIAEMEQGVAAVEGRSNAAFIQNFKEVISEFKNNGVADAVANVKANAEQTATAARLQAAESQRDIQI